MYRAWFRWNQFSSALGPGSAGTARVGLQEFKLLCDSASDDLIILVQIESEPLAQKYLFCDVTVHQLRELPGRR